ncbi:hypothetical protein MNBD_NITROSPINAE02-1915 [hydrothermal vent metagenome]|uniref:HTH tetR-type domain-containing protein n=1 Tax=hydrothermal vent metagenome TaxID=652676 RepID=A0A3B1C3T3_9ZZZZ
METTEGTKRRILEAANARFRTYGYGKTTMAEIARDCDMSAANLYRFFENKKDIAAEGAAEYFTAKERTLRDVVKRGGMTAAQKLEEFMMVSFDLMVDLLENEPKINELIDVVCIDCSWLISRHDEAMQALLAEILAEGNRTGEFDVEDILLTAQMVKYATIMFHHPGLVSMCPQERQRESVKGIVTLLVEGLYKR